MKILIILIFTLTSFAAFSQPVNDDCEGTINLGTAPVCMEAVFSNVGATGSDIGSNSDPECWSEAASQDVWFSFIADSEITNYTISISGVDDNGNPMSNIQAALYRGFCPDNVFALNTCASGEIGASSLDFEISGLTPNDLYYIRIDNAGGAAFSGEFNVCVNEADTEYTIDQGGSTECSGVLYDSGGSNGNYSNDEDYTFTICPGVLNQCIEFNLEYYNIEDGYDVLTFYNGEDTDAPLIAQISSFDLGSIGGGGSVCKTIYAENCLTLQFKSDDEIVAEGFKASWNCSNAACILPEVVEIDTTINEKSILQNLSSALVDITVNSINCENGAVGVFRNAGNTDLGLDKGILLTTGKAAIAIGPNEMDGDGFGHISDGDADLDALSQLFGSDLLSTTHVL